MTVQVKMTNEEYIKSLKARGLDTTSVGAKEANFVDYGNALGSNVQNMVLDSFGKEGTTEGKADQELQAKIAAGWKNNNFKDSAAIKKYCEANGIEVSVTYVKTQHIVDNKKGGKYANNKTDASGGAIAVYTFDDGKGGEIKVADANGNGGLETEELFMNEILTGITSDIATISDANMSADTGMSQEDKAKLFNSSIMTYKLDQNGNQMYNEDGEAIVETDWKRFEEEAKDVKYELNKDKFTDMLKTLMIVNGWTKEKAVSELQEQYVFDGFDPDSVEVKV